jgi:hypothetical protein
MSEVWETIMEIGRNRSMISSNASLRCCDAPPVRNLSRAPIDPSRLAHIRRNSPPLAALQSQPSTKNRSHTHNTPAENPCRAVHLDGSSPRLARTARNRSLGRSKDIRVDRGLVLRVLLYSALRDDDSGDQGCTELLASARKVSCSHCSWRWSYHS